jgi:hypothetical protein
VSTASGNDVIVTSMRGVCVVECALATLEVGVLCRRRQGDYLGKSGRAVSVRMTRRIHGLSIQGLKF